jgi:hypothetical protein
MLVLMTYTYLMRSPPLVGIPSWGKIDAYDIERSEEETAACIKRF